MGRSNQSIDLEWDVLSDSLVCRRLSFAISFSPPFFFTICATLFLFPSWLSNLAVPYLCRVFPSQLLEHPQL